MIIKHYDLNKIELNKAKLILFYGKNHGLKNESVNLIFKNSKQIFKYEEKDILDNVEIFFDKLLSKSFFENEKFVIIKRSTDKILKIIEEIDNKNIKDVNIILISENLEKKSKLRSFFEKSKKNICVAFYPDSFQTLSKLTFDFLKKNKISLSQANVNLIINKSNEDRENLMRELDKIEYFCKQGNKIDTKIILKLINLSENHSISELIDNCLAKNKNKIVNILNENNFTKEDCVLITRIFLNKSKNILKLTKEYKNNNNINLTISLAKPPIFWKDKEIVKQQIYKWNTENINQLIYKLNDLELLLKKNLENSVNIITDFIFNYFPKETNN